MTAARTPALRVLILEDDAQAAGTIKHALEPRHSCLVASSDEAKKGGLRREDFDVVVSGFWRGERGAAKVPVVLVVDDDDNRAARPSGIFEVVKKPVDDRELRASVERAARARDAATPTTNPIVGSSPAFMKALAKIDRAVATNAPILLVGESGTGKDVLAARTHTRGPRRHRPFVVSRPPPSQPGSLDESLDRAQDGTLYVDEITRLDAASQAQLAFVLESNADVRIMASTRHDVFAAREHGLSDELFFRLAPYVIEIPPLRKRKEDIVPLARWFVERARGRNPSARARLLTPAAEHALLSALWPGNVRQLEAVIDAAVVLGDRERIDAGDLAIAEPRKPEDDDVFRAPGEICSLRTLSERYVGWVLARTDGDRRRAASLLGIDVSTLYRRQRKRPPR